MIVSASRVTKSFGTLNVLNGVSMEAHEGEVISILGRSGSGKTTFLRCLNLLETPDSGEISIADARISFDAGRAQPLAPTTNRVAQLRKRSAMVFQQFNLWSHWTVLQNVANVPHFVQGLPWPEAKRRAEMWLVKTGIAAKMHAYPAQLSGGQQQRVGIARALAAEPKVLLFDEPTSALDPELVQEVLSVMRALAAEGRTMIVVTHELGFARDVSDRVLFFDGGIILEDGPAHEVLSNPSREQLKRFLNAHQRI